MRQIRRQLRIAAGRRIGADRGFLIADRAPHRIIRVVRQLLRQGITTDPQQRPPPPAMASPAARISSITPCDHDGRALVTQREVSSEPSPV